MYRFQINAHTRLGEFIGLVGSTSALGQWNIARCVRLYTSADCYPLWQTRTAIEILPSFRGADCSKVEYKYVRFGANGSAQWELGANRWMPIDPGSGTLVVDDGEFGYPQPQPFAYPEPAVETLLEAFSGLKIAVVGSSVACGQKAWMLNGWTRLLSRTLQQRYDHQLVNLSEVGANVSRTIDRFSQVVKPQQPDIVIIALSLGNEGLAYCPASDRLLVQRRFESGVQRLVKMVRELGARPMLGSVYPHGDYTPEHYNLLQDTHSRMLTWRVPILDWLVALEDGQGRWRSGISFDPSHPNTIGHRIMYQAIDLTLFDIDKDELAIEKQRFQQPSEVLVYRDEAGFQVCACPDKQQMRIGNPSPYSYTIAPDWQPLQACLQRQAGLIPDIYIAIEPGTPPFLAVRDDGAIETTVNIPPGADLEYRAASHYFSPHNSKLLFYDGHLEILQTDEQHLWIINRSDHEFNIQPMWREIRSALKALPSGVYEDPLQPNAPFRTLMIGKDGLESRVKAPPRSAVRLQYVCKLSDLDRVAILPLGDRCAVRMMLYKMEYDGPAFPFDLTRTTQIGDVADLIKSGFDEMWNPAFLHYNPDAGRLYHSKWTGLSFAHEVEDTDDPLRDLSPVFKRMRDRYSARARRFWHVLRHCDSVLFIRTGIADRPSVIDLVNKLKNQCQGKPFHLMLLSPQSSEEFLDLPQVLHYNLEFNPDRMYEDLEHWMYCTSVMRGILESRGVSSRNLFWCPPNPPQ